MKIGKYKIKFNYGILRGFLDVVGLLVAYLIYQTTYAFISTNLNPDMVLHNIYPDGVPLDRWLPGLIFPAIALGVIVFSVVFMFIKHKEPKAFVITEENAQKYYDTIMITNSLMRILALIALWDYCYIHQSNLMFGNISWLSFQTVLDIAVGALIVYIIRNRVKTFAKVRPKEERKAVSAQKAGTKKAVNDDEEKLPQIKIKKSDDDEIMRS